MRVFRLCGISLAVAFFLVLVSCGGEAIALLDAATAAAEAVVPVFTTDPAVISCVNGMAGGLDQAGAELETSDSKLVRAQKIYGYLSGPLAACTALAGLPPRDAALIGALTAAVQAFLAAIGPPPAAGPETRAAKTSRPGKPNQRIEAIRDRLRVVVRHCKAAN